MPLPSYCATCGHLSPFHDVGGSCAWRQCTCTRMVHALTPREYEVLVELAKGRSAPQIAKVLSVTKKTVETHRYNMMVKAGVHSVVQLVLAALRSGIIQMSQLPGVEMAVAISEPLEEGLTKPES